MDDKQGWTKIGFTVDLPALFEEISMNDPIRSNRGALMGLNQIKVKLDKIAKRAIEINDFYILEQLEAIGVVNREKEPKDG